MMRKLLLHYLAPNQWWTKKSLGDPVTFDKYQTRGEELEKWLGKDLEKTYSFSIFTPYTDCHAYIHSLTQKTH